MALSAANQRLAWAAAYAIDKTLAAFIKPDLDAAAAAADAWCDANQASYVAALPATFRTQSNAAQKALLLAYVCLKRTGVI